METVPVSMRLAFENLAVLQRVSCKILQRFPLWNRFVNPGNISITFKAAKEIEDNRTKLRELEKKVDILRTNAPRDTEWDDIVKVHGA